MAPDLQRLVVEFAYGDIHDRPGLDRGSRELVILAVLTTLGDADRQIQTHVGSALGSDVSPVAIVEALMQTIPYVGFPRAIRAIESAKAAFEKYGVLEQLATPAGDPPRTDGTAGAVADEPGRSR